MSTEQEKTAEVLKSAAQIIRTVSAERDVMSHKLAEEQAKNAAYERRTRCEKVAAQMHQKGIHSDVDFPDLVDSLEKSAQAGKLNTIEEAVELVGSDMSLKTASIHEAPAATGSDFERFLTGSVG